MMTLILMTLVCLQDPRESERQRIELLRRVGPSMVGSGPACQVGATSSDCSSCHSSGRAVHGSRSTYDPVPLLGSQGSKRLIGSTEGGNTLLVPASAANLKWQIYHPSEINPDWQHLDFPAEVVDTFVLENFRSGATFASPASETLPGVFIDDQGTLVTTTRALDHHRFSGTVRQTDGKRVRARIVTRNDDIGLAVLQLDPPAKTPPLGIADSSTLFAGQELQIASLAGGSIVLRRAVVIAPQQGSPLNGSEDRIHLDYPALPSELGGAVLNAEGKLVGILSEEIFETAGPNLQVPRRALAIPSATLKAFLAKRDASGKFEPGSLGVAVRDQGKGLEITDVREGSAAEKAGLKVGDVVTGLDGRELRHGADLSRILRLRAHESLELAILRGERALRVPVTVGVYEPPKPAPDPKEVLRIRAGLDIQDLTPELCRYLDLDKQTTGVVVHRVMAGGAADQAGLRKGDVLTAMDNGPLASASAVREKIKTLPKEAYVVFDTVREGKKVPVVLKVR